MDTQTVQEPAQLVDKHAIVVDPNNPLTTPQVVNRNDIDGTLKVFKGQRGTWEGKYFQAYQVEVADTDTKASEDSVFLNCLNFIGKINVKNSLNNILKRYGQDFVEDSIGAAGTANEGIFSLDRFITYWANLKSSAMKASELQEAYQNEVEIYQTLTQELMDAFEAQDVAKIAVLGPKVKASSASLNSLKSEFEERKARRSKEAATETVQAA